jgi:maltose-binding protein MalE
VVARLVGAAAAAVVAITMLALSFVMRSPVQQITPAEKVASTLARTLSKAARESAHSPRTGWVVSKATSAERTMVIDVEAERLEQARGIAVQLVEPVRSHGYQEILIYVRQPGRRIPVVRRIQWTPRGGYVESEYADR